MGRAKDFRGAEKVGDALPTSPELRTIGQQVLTKLPSVKTVDEILDIIPPQANIPGESKI